MRKVIAAAVVLLSTQAACSGRATVLSADARNVTMQWDATTTTPGIVTRQADLRCDPLGWHAKRAIPIADNADGSIHTTRFTCKQLNGGT